MLKDFPIPTAIQCLPVDTKALTDYIQAGLWQGKQIVPSVLTVPLWGTMFIPWSVGHSSVPCHPHCDSVTVFTLSVSHTCTTVTLGSTSLSPQLLLSPSRPLSPTHTHRRPPRPGKPVNVIQAPAAIDYRALKPSSFFLRHSQGTIWTVPDF